MRQITVLLLFISMTGYGQSEKIKGLNYQTVFTNAVWNYLNYISESEKRSVDTLFIELNDTLNFNLPKKIQTTVIEVMPISELLPRLKSKPYPHFLRLQSWTGNKNTMEVIAFERLFNYSNNMTEVVEEPKNHTMIYSMKKNNLLHFKTVKKNTTGCRRFYKLTDDNQLHLTRSICS